MQCKIPGTAREIVDNLINMKKFTVKQIAQMLGVSSKTVYKIKKGVNIQPKIHLNLIQLYLSLHQQHLVKERYK